MDGPERVLSRELGDSVYAAERPSGLRLREESSRGIPWADAYAGLAMGTGIPITLTSSDRLRLEAVISNRNTPQKHVWRVAINRYVAETITRPKPFTWTADPET